MRILYICGITPEWPANLRPLPFLDTGAPHGNIQRLVERLSHPPFINSLEIEVVSAAGTEQMAQIARQWPPGSLNAKYRQVIINDKSRRLSAWLLKHLPFVSGVFNRLWGVPSWQSIIYLKNIRRLYHSKKPDMVVLDDSPQYIRGLARFVPSDRLIFYCRGDMGSSRRFLHRAGRVFVTNSPLGNWVRQINPGVTRITVIPNTLPDEYLAVTWDDQRFHQPERQILFAGRLSPVKGPEHLLAAFAKVYSQVNGLSLVMVGREQPGGLQAGSHPVESYEERLRRIAAELLPAEAVEWRGWLEGAALREAYRQAYCAVFPSTCIEGFGMVALEAMACGTPVIVSDRPGFASIVSQGGGLIVNDPTDIMEIAGHILRLIQQPDQAAALGKQAYQIARHYSKEQAANSFFTVING